MRIISQIVTRLIEFDEKSKCVANGLFIIRSFKYAEIKAARPFAKLRIKKRYNAYKDKKIPRAMSPL